MGYMFIEASLIFAFIAMICWGFGDFFIQRSSRKIGNVESLLFIGIIGLIGLFPLVIGDIHALFEWQNLLLIGFLGVLTFVAGLLDFEALKEGKLSVIEVVLEIELPITILLGLIFFGETLTAMQWVVISFIFIGILLMAFKKAHFKNIKLFLEKGVLIAILGSIGMGGINFLTAASSRQVSPIMAIWGPALVFSILCIIVIWRREGFSKTFANLRSYKWLVLGMGIFDTAAWTTYAFATNQGELAVITAITESYPAICLFLGLWINKEKIGWHQYLGAALAICASILLAFVV